ncbi:MAG: universal stress protein [Thermoplasmatota archaeon]
MPKATTTMPLSHPRQTGPIVVGVDFTPASEPALRKAMELAHAWHTRIVLLHILKPLGAPGLNPGHPTRPASDNETADLTLEASPRAWLSRLEKAGIQAEYATLPGPAPAALAAEASRLHARVLVLGSHVHGRLAREFLGSVASDLTENSEIPVMVVPAT